MLAMSSFSIANVVEAASPKAGFIFFHDEASTYDANFMRAAEQACREQGVEFVFKTAVPESEECTNNQRPLYVGAGALAAGLYAGAGYHGEHLLHLPELWPKCPADVHIVLTCAEFSLEPKNS